MSRIRGKPSVVPLRKIIASAGEARALRCLASPAYVGMQDLGATRLHQTSPVRKCGAFRLNEAERRLSTFSSLYTGMNSIKNALVVTVLSIMLPASVYAASISNDTEGSADVGVSGTVNANLGASGEADVVLGIPGAIEVVVTRSDVEGEGAVSASASPESVSVDTDVSGFVAAQVASDENVSKIESSAHRISVTYPQKARLFGFIPVTVDATATVLADGTVNVRYPWYAFLMVTNQTALESEIESRVTSLNSLSVRSVSAEADAELELAASVQAKLIDEVRTVMESTLTADVGGSVQL